MSEGFELGPFHVPQQSRRDKLRSLDACAGLQPLYDPMLACAAAGHASFLHPLSPLPIHPLVKQESLNLLGFPQTVARNDPSSSSSTSSSSSSHHLLDLPPALGDHPFHYTAPGDPKSFRDFGLFFKPPQGLSLSLSSHAFTGESSLVADKGLGAFVVVGGGDVARSAGPLGPFTGYAEVLKGSRFLKPAQQLLQEYCDVGQEAYLERISAKDAEMERMSDCEIVDDPVGVGTSGDSGEHRRKKTRLICMLDEVYKRYKHYYQQTQAVMTSFGSVHGLSTAAPYTTLALKALSKHFRCLKNAITDQLRSTSKGLTEGSFRKEEVPKFRVIDQSLHHQRLANGASIVEQPHVWRPQRGLPERAVAVLRAWLFEHFLHPYPTDSDKQMLAKQTGLSRNQVSNWFINARVRLWKPMVEEIHSLEMRQGQKVADGGEQNLSKQGSLHPRPTPPSIEQCLNSAAQRNQDSSAKHFDNELAQITNGNDQTMSFSYNMSNHPNSLGIGVSMASGSSGVSLTLGLHQNDNVACLSESLPLGVAHFGLEDGNNAYGLSGFDNQSRQFGRDLHDFVG